MDYLKKMLDFIRNKKKPKQDICYLEKAFKFIRNAEDADFEGEKSEELVKKAEDFLGLEFPQEYRKFLREFGCGDVNGAEIFGIINDKFETNGVPDAIALTARERNEHSLAKTVILIGDSDEYYYALDLARKHDGNVPVIDLLPQAKPEDCEVLWDSFGEFLCAQFDIA